ncbi:DUF1353 domain-containing protein [Pseudorhodoplanes sp.]|uniref:DUF1353 domain-containing protein n=1 Tax=Pseudorhodoplanes sp. TaxID=1934341 RepID=UPI002D01D1B5|nr:DUF1353 domain-containing protein [Pseudorhodoplanes sp.]HWV51659.1 DUF1353 domain-containing protein [Pseudorhodoplanes sp.]
MSDDGRTATLLAQFAYIDPNGKHWDVPTGTRVDGASIPWPLWSIIGSPWTGRYREASVVHDYFCDTKTAPWKLVHRNFYTAMLANQVDGIQARIMYAAVYRFGPRWDFEYTPDCPNCAAVPHRVDQFLPEFNQAEYDALEARARGGASVEALEAEADALFRKDIQKQEIGTPVFIR